MIGLTAGAGREIITPPVGGRLYGYAPDVYSDSVNDDLTATAVVFKSGGATEIRAAVSGETGIPAGNVILCATHTHSGPCTAGNTGWGEVDRGYVDSTFIPKILAAVKTALGGLRPVVLGVGRVHSDIGVNRRQFNKDNTISLGQNPWGCYDPAMTVLSFRSEAGEPVANIVHYGAHCTAAGKNAEITRDWAGVMIDRLEAESGALTMFINGAEGDVGPRLTNGQTVGNIRYAMALSRRTTPSGYKNRGIPPRARVRLRPIELPYAPVMPLELAREELQKFGSQNQSGRQGIEYLSSVAAPETGLLAETGSASGRRRCASARLCLFRSRLSFFPKSPCGFAGSRRFPMYCAPAAPTGTTATCLRATRFAGAATKSICSEHPAFKRLPIRPTTASSLKI